MKALLYPSPIKTKRCAESPHAPSFRKIFFSALRSKDERQIDAESDLVSCFLKVTIKKQIGFRICDLGINASILCGITALLLSILLLASTAVRADDATDAASRLPLPRFAALRSDQVNMRTGPGTRYPIEWVYTRKGLPVEVVEEYDIWRRVRDSEGAEGWVHKTELTGKRAVVVTGTPRELRDSRDDSAAIVAHLQPGAIGQLLSCAPDWCKAKFDGIKGYLRKTDFWGAYAGEVFD